MGKSEFEKQVEIADDIMKILVHLYEDVKNRQEEAYRRDIENGVEESLAGWKTYPKTRAQLDILMEAMRRIDAEYGVNVEFIMNEEGVEEV